MVGEKVSIEEKTRKPFDDTDNPDAAGDAWPVQPGPGRW